MCEQIYIYRESESQMSFGSSERIPNDWWLLMSTNQMQPLRLKLQAYWIIKYYESFSPPPMCKCECECEISWNETNEEKLFGSPNVSSWSHLWCTAHVPTFPMRFFSSLFCSMCVSLEWICFRMRRIFRQVISVVFYSLHAGTDCVHMVHFLFCHCHTNECMLIYRPTMFAHF